MTLMQVLFASWLEVRTAVSSRRIGMAVLGAGILLAAAVADEPKFIRLSKPQTLSFAELVELSQTEEPQESLAAKMDKLLHTPFVSNEAYLAGAKPIRPSSKALGPFIRAAFWNIERGIELDSIKIALTKPDQFDKIIADRKDPEAKPLTGVEITLAKEQLAILRRSDVLILNEVDDGVTRTDYRDIARELA